MIDALWRALGVDPDARRVLRDTFWELSRRGGSALVARRGGTKPPSMTGLYLLYGSIGLLSSFPVLFGAPKDAFATQLCTTTLVLLALAIVGDFAAVVIAPGDDEILFPLPLSSRTYLAARLSVAAAHTTRLAASFGVAPAVVAAAALHDAPFGLVLLAAVVLTGLFALVVSFALYRVALSLLGGERLRTALAFLPALVSFAVAIGPQLLGAPSRMGTTVPGDVEPVTREVGAWALSVPSSWFASLASWAGGVPLSPTLLARVCLGLAAVPLGAFLLVRALGGGFLADLIALVGAKDAGPARRRPQPLPPGRLARRLFGLSTEEARAGYLLALGAFRSRETRARAFAFVLMPLAFTLLGLFRPQQSAFGGPLFGLFFLGASAGTVISMLPYHEHRDAAWIYEALPFRRYGSYLLGVLAASLSRHVLPWMLVIVALAIVRDPTPTGAGLALHVATGSLLAVPLALGREDDPPFSRAFAGGEQGARLTLYLLTLLLLGAVMVVGSVLEKAAPIALVGTSPAFLAIAWARTRAIGRRLDARPPDPFRPLRRA